MERRTVWTDEAITRFWDWKSRQDPDQNDYFSHKFGEALVRLLAKWQPAGRVGSVLDYGCGPGHLAKHLTAGGWQVWGLDSSQRSVDAANIALEGHPSWEGAHTSLDAIEGIRFDAATCVETLEHLDDEKSRDLLGLLRRVLKPGGVLLVTTPHAEALDANPTYCPFCDVEFHPMQHVRSFDQETLRRTLEDAGFEPLSIRALDLWGYRSRPPTWSVRAQLGWMRRRLRRSRVGPHLVAVCRSPLR